MLSEAPVPGGNVLLCSGKVGRVRLTSHPPRGPVRPRLPQPRLVGGRSRSHLRSRALRPRWRQGWGPRRRFRVPGLPGLPGLQGPSGPLGPPVQATAPEPLEPSGPSGPRTSQVTDEAPGKNGPWSRTPEEGAAGPVEGGGRGTAAGGWARGLCCDGRPRPRRGPMLLSCWCLRRGGPFVWITTGPPSRRSRSGSQPCNRVAIRRPCLTCRGVRPRGIRARRSRNSRPAQRCTRWS